MDVDATGHLTIADMLKRSKLLEQAANSDKVSDEELHTLVDRARVVVRQAMVMRLLLDVKDPLESLQQLKDDAAVCIRVLAEEANIQRTAN